MDSDVDAINDAIELLHAIDNIPDTLLFRPLEAHRKKLDDVKRKVTRNRVKKLLAKEIYPLLIDQGFVESDPWMRGSVSFRPQHACRIDHVMFRFYSPSETEEFYCTSASFSVCIYRDLHPVPTDVATKDGFHIWYIEPDGSNLEHQVSELRDLLAPYLSAES